VHAYAPPVTHANAISPITFLRGKGVVVR